MSMIHDTSFPRIAVRVCVAVLLTAVLVRIFIIDSFTVEGNSMAPTIIGGDYVFVNKLARWFDAPERHDIVVGNFRGLEGTKVIKRVVGLPREWIYISEGEIRSASSREEEPHFVKKIDVEAFTATSTEPYAYRLDPHEYFLMGDNGNGSIDSRNLGPVDVYDIDGTVFLSVRWENLKLTWFK